MAVPATREADDRNIAARSKDFVEDSVAELKKVTWPDYPQLKSATLVVLVFVTVISLVIFLMDLTIRKVIEIVMGIFGA
jgi:preprotein translocase subunit SecE